MSIAPIRTRPERVYATPTELYDPSGNHVPFILDNLFRNPSSREAKTVLDAITRFGAESGMFSQVRLRKLGSKVGDPFQLMVAIGGKERNLIDVGYGVSQALPIIIQTALSNTRDTVLIQQPEVHLHPRAQAALGDFFTRLIHGGRRRLVIETHSDYIIDRIRSAVASGLPRESVKIIFLERKKLDSVPHVIDLDGQGNVTDAPSSYRSFFLEEQRRVLTRGA
ncbi:MAG: AAA family ATPase [Nitrososphaerales archaeon]